MQSVADFAFFMISCLVRTSLSIITFSLRGRAMHFTLVELDDWHCLVDSGLGRHTIYRSIVVKVC